MNMKVRSQYTPSCPEQLKNAASLENLCHGSDGNTVILKKGRNTVALFQTPEGEKYVIKSFKKPNIIQRIAYTFFTSGKAIRAYRNAKKLREAGINTPHEASYVEVLEKGLIGNSYFVCRHCDALNLLDSWVWTSPYDKTILDILVKHLVMMHTKGVLHGDTNLGNFLYHPDTGTIDVIDTNRTRFKSTLSPKECLDNMVRLTHRRELLEDIVRHYAAARGWDVAKCAAYILTALDRYEHKRHRHDKFKNCIKKLSHEQPT